MAIERTLSIIKPDATRAQSHRANHCTARGCRSVRVIAQKRIWWKKKDAKKFYEVHKGQPYYKDLIVFATSGPIVVQVLEGEDAIAKNREVMGATNPVDAAPGTIRQGFWRQPSEELGARLGRHGNGEARKSPSASRRPRSWGSADIGARWHA